MSQAELTTIGESCEFFNGKAHEKSIDENGKYIVVNSKFISQEGRVVKRTKEQMFPLYKGDIVMVMSDVPNGKALAKCFIIDQDDAYSLNQRICCIRSKEFDTKYLYYQLNRNEHFLTFNNGENQTNLRKGDILNCPLIKPSMEEQERMVAEFDLAFLNLNKAIANTEKNSINTNELFESFSQSIFETKGENWIDTKLADVCHLITKGSSPKWQGVNYVNKPGILFVTSENVGENEMLLEVKKYVEEKFNLKDSKSILKKGDVLTNIVGASIGRTAIFNCDEMANINQAVCLIRCNKELLFNEFLMYLLNSPLTKQHLHDNEVNNARANLSLGFFRNLNIALPPLEIQKEIVNKIKEFHFEINRLQVKYQIKTENLNELKGGVLKRAFENELIEAE